MNINIRNHELFFAGFYILSFTMISALAVIFSKKRQLPVSSVLLMLVSTVFLTIIGSQLFTVNITDWLKIISAEDSGVNHGRSAIGGVLFGLVGFLLSV